MAAKLGRRAFIGGALVTLPILSSCDLRAAGQVGRLSRSATAKAVKIFDAAREIGVLPPQTERSAAAPDKLDLADLVLKALEAAPRNARSSSVAKDAGELLSSITDAERDGQPFDVERRSVSAPPFDEKEKLNLRRMFQTCKIQSGHQAELTKAATFITSGDARSRYEEVSKLTSGPVIPWYVIGALHYREANLNFLGHLHNGDRLDRRTINVPKGRPKGPWPPNPFDPRAAWRLSAEDALKELKPIESWTAEQMLYGFEKYNGFGYRPHGVPSPYVWNYSQFYTHGGYPRDGKWEDNYVSRQAGLAPLIKVLSDMTSDIKIEYEA
jgi:lysozyme family protein